MLESCLNIVNPIDARVLSLEQSESTSAAAIAALTTDVANVQNSVNNNSDAITSLQSSVEETQSTLATLQTSVDTVGANVAKETSVSELSTMITELEAKIDSIQPSTSTLLGGWDPNEKSIGDTVYIQHSTYGWIEFEIVGKNIDGTSTTTLLAKKIITTKQWNNTMDGNYSTSGIRTWLNGEFYNGFSDDIKSAIKQVSKVQNIEGSSTTTETTQDYCWLLSIEDINNNTYTLSNGSYIKYNNSNVAGVWLTRSPFYLSGNNGYVAGVNVEGSIIGNYTMTDIYGVVPAIVL